MIISGSIPGNIVLSDPSLVATNDYYFIKSNGRTEANVLDYKVIFSNNPRGTPGTHQHDTHFFGATNEFSLLFGASIFFIR